MLLAWGFVLLWLVSCERPTKWAARPTPTPAPPPGPKVRQAGALSTQWRGATIKTSWEIPANKAVMLYLRTQARYQVVSKMRRDGVPAPVIF